VAEPGDVARPGVFGRIVAWLLVLVLVAAVVLAAVITNSVWIVVAAVAGRVVAFLLTRVFRLLRRRPLVGIGLLLAVLVVGAAGVYLAAMTMSSPSSTEPSPGSAVGPISVPYKATGQLDGDTVTLREEISLDAGTDETVRKLFGPLGAGQDTDQLGTPAGWRAGPVVDGYPSWTRTRTITPDQGNWVSSSLSIPVDLGSLPIRGSTVSMVPRDGSRLELAAPKGALGATYPDASKTVNDPRSGGGEVTTIPVDRSTVDVSVAVLSGALRNPVGQQVYDAVEWGPLPWAVGAFFALLASLAGDKLKQLLGLAARRVIRRGPVPQRT
jgi:hypothetical protein